MSSKSISTKNVALSGCNGKVGNVRFYTKGDRTYLRVAASVSKNPRTVEQMRGRVKWLNILNTWYFLKPFLRDLFEDATPAVSAYNLFTQRSTYCTSVYLPKDQARTRCCVAAPYAISQGTLMPIDYKKDTEGVLVTNIRLGEGFVLNEDTTVGQLSAAIQSNNPNFEWNDEIMFVAVEQETRLDGMPSIRVAAFPLLLDNTDPSKVWNKVKPLGFSSTRNYLCASASLQPGCYGWIHIRRKERKTSVSCQHLYNLNEELLRYYCSEEAFQAALPTYGKAKSSPF